MKNRTDVQDSLQNYNDQIKHNVLIYSIGTLCFALISIGSIWFAYHTIIQNFLYNDDDIPKGFIVLGISGMYFLVEMVRSSRLKADIPKEFYSVNTDDYPQLFRLISEVTNNLKQDSPKNVYICDDAIAAVFIQPKLRNLFIEPKRHLVIGKAFLTQMDDDEIRAMLYHEFGHYAQNEMSSSLKVYSIGQFTKSFITINKQKKDNNIRLYLSLFSYFSLLICEKINHSYSHLSKKMEFDADDVALRYVQPNVLQRALIKAACVRYNYEFMLWGINQVKGKGISPDNQYHVLRIIGAYSRPRISLLSDDVIERIQRVGDLNIHKSESASLLMTEAMQHANNTRKASNTCSAKQFANWLMGGLSIYENQKEYNSSVKLVVNLEHYKHKLPLFDGHYNVMLDNKKIGVGNFRKGYTIKRSISPGKHTLSISVLPGLSTIPFEFETISGKTYHVEMDYRVRHLKGEYEVFAEKIIEM